MPNQIDGLANLQVKLFRENFFDVLDSLSQQETQIMIPQLSAITNNLELIPFLKLLGIVSVFTPNPNSKQKSDVFVQSVKQNAFFSTSFTALNSVGTIANKYGKYYFSNSCAKNTVFYPRNRDGKNYTRSE